MVLLLEPLFILAFYRIPNRFYELYSFPIYIKGHLRLSQDPVMAGKRSPPDEGLYLLQGSSSPALLQTRKTRKCLSMACRKPHVASLHLRPSPRCSWSPEGIKIFVPPDARTHSWTTGRLRTSPKGDWVFLNHFSFQWSSWDYAESGWKCLGLQNKGNWWSHWLGSRELNPGNNVENCALSQI